MIAAKRTIDWLDLLQLPNFTWLQFLFAAACLVVLIWQIARFISRVDEDIDAPANLLLDVGGYRAHRVEQLNRLALRMAEQAVEQKKVIKMEPMPAFERRLVHLALREFNGASTQSEGDGELRRVVISPTT